MQRARRVPRTFCRSAPVRQLVSRNRRGRPSPRVPATSNCGDGGVLRGWDTTASTRRLATPPWHRRAGVWTGCLVGRKHARAPAGRRRGHSEVMTPRRFRDTASDPVRADKMCGAPFCSSATSLDRGDRPTRHPGRASASSHGLCAQRAIGGCVTTERAASSPATPTSTAPAGPDARSTDRACTSSRIPRSRATSRRPSHRPPRAVPPARRAR